METWVWSIALMVLAFLIVLVEMFIPSGGVLGVLSALAVIGSIVLGFSSSWQFGMVMIITACLGLPLVFMSAVKWWPQTPLGRLIVARPPAGDEAVLPDNDELRRLRGLIGRKGVARSMMLPSGIVEIDGRTYDAVSEGMPIEPGQTIVATEVKMRRLEVRLVSGEVPPLPPAKTSPTNPDDILSQPIDALGIEPIDPLA